MKQKWYFNVILAVIAAVMAIMQEVWLGTPLNFTGSFVFGSIIGFCFSAGAEWLKILPKFINYWEWHWRDVAIGSVFGVVAALITALAVC